MKREIERLARENSGFVTSAELTKLGLQRRELTLAVEEGELTRLDRGLYCTPMTWEDEYVIAQHRFSRGVFSHDTALYLLGLSDQAPESLTMSFPRGYNPSAANHAGILTKSSPAQLHDIGETTVLTPYGNLVACYNAERKLRDMLRGTSSPDLQLFSPAIRAYLSSHGSSIPMLRSYAGSLGVRRKIEPYLEVLL